MAIEARRMELARVRSKELPFRGRRCAEAPDAPSPRGSAQSHLPRGDQNGGLPMSWDRHAAQTTSAAVLGPRPVGIFTVAGGDFPTDGKTSASVRSPRLY